MDYLLEKINKSEFMNNDISRHHLFSSRIAVDFSSWRKNHLSDKTFVLLLAGVVGLLTGVGAFVMKRLVAELSAGLTSHLRADSGNPTLLLLPIVGIVLTGIFLSPYRRDESCKRHVATDEAVAASCLQTETSAYHLARYCERDNPRFRRLGRHGRPDCLRRSGSRQ